MIGALTQYLESMRDIFAHALMDGDTIMVPPQLGAALVRGLDQALVHVALLERAVELGMREVSVAPACSAPGETGVGAQHRDGTNVIPFPVIARVSAQNEAPLFSGDAD